MHLSPELVDEQPLPQQTSKPDTTSLTGITKTNVQRKSQIRPSSKPPASRMPIQTTKLAELPSQIARAQRSLIAISLKLGKCNTGLHNQYASIVMYYSWSIEL